MKSEKREKKKENEKMKTPVYDGDYFCTDQFEAIWYEKIWKWKMKMLEMIREVPIKFHQNLEEK